MHGRGNGTAFCNLRCRRQRHAAGPQSLADHAGRPGGAAHRDSDQGVARSGTTAAAPSSSCGTRTTTARSPRTRWSSSSRPTTVRRRVQSSKFYNHYSLTKTLDAAFGLPCLNHACDAGVEVMSDLFQDYANAFALAHGGELSSLHEIFTPIRLRQIRRSLSFLLACTGRCGAGSRCSRIRSAQHRRRALRDGYASAGAHTA